MTFKRIIIIILVLLLIAGALFGLSWYAAKRKAVKNGTTPLTFKEFVGIGSPRYPGAVPNEGLSGEFTGASQHDQNTNGINDWLEDRDSNGTLDGNEDKNNNGELDGSEDQDGDGINNRDENVNSGGGNGDPFGPGSNNGGGDSGTGDPWGPGGGGGGFTTDPWDPRDPGDPTDPTDPDPGDPTDPTEPGGPGIVVVDVPDPDDQLFELTENLACSAEDTNIEFTPSEIARLAQLQALFDNISETLYDDAAAEEQRALYTTFKIKTTQTKDLITYCESKSTQLPSQMRIRVPTPFYNGGANANTFTNNPIVTSDYNSGSLGRRPIASYPITAATLVERLLRINIW